MTARRSVLHVLPHPGGGGETYVDALEAMDGYRFERVFLAPTAKPVGGRLSILRNAFDVQRQARAYDVLHVHGEVASTLCLPALLSRPSVVTLHGLHLLRRLSGPKAAAARANLRLVLRAASRTICVSLAEREELGFAGKRAVERSVVIHNGVGAVDPVMPDERATARAEFGVPEAATVAAWIASLNEHKDPWTPIRATIEVARSGLPLVLLIAGDGPLRADVERAAHEASGSDVKILGFRRDVRPVLAAADVFVLSSLREGLSFALLEAMSLGLVPVVSDAPGNPEAVGDAGIVVPFGDVAAFAASFGRLAGNEAQRVATGQRAQERVARLFRSDEMVRRTRAVYDEVVLERVTRRRRCAGGAGSPGS